MARRPDDAGGERNVAGGALGGRAGGGAGGGRTVATGGLNFDTAGLRQFTAMMRTAGEATKKFWEPFAAAKVRDNMRAVDQFFDRLEKRLDAVAKKSAMVALPGAPGGGQPGQPAQPGQRPTGNGGNSRLPTLPGMINVPGRQPIGTAFRAVQAYRNGGTSSFGGVRSGGTPGASPTAPGAPGGASISPGAAAGIAFADWAVNKGIKFADQRTPQALQMEQAATMATMVGGNPSWSAQYRNSVQNNLVRTRGFWSTEDVAGAVMQGTQIGARGGTLGGMLQSAGVLQTINPSVTAQQAMGVNTGLQQTGVVNSLLRLGVQASPRGQMKNATQIFQEVTPRLFGTDHPTQEQILAARLPGSRKNLQIVYAFNGDQNITDQYLTWLESSAATGSPVVTQDQADKSPLAQTGLGQARRTSESRYLRQSRSDRGLISQFETEQRLREDANDTMDKLLGKFPGLGNAIGTATGWFSTLNKALGPFAAALGGNLLGNILRGRGGGGPGVPGVPGGGGGGVPGGGGGGVPGVPIPGGSAGGIPDPTMGGPLLGGPTLPGGFSVGEGAVAVAGATVATGIEKHFWPKAPAGQALLKKEDKNSDSFNSAADTMRHRAAREDYAKKYVDTQGVLPAITPGARQRWISDAIIPWAWRQYARENGNTLPDIGKLSDAQASGPDVGDPVGRWGWRNTKVDIGDPSSGGATPGALRGPGRSQGMNADFLRRLQKMFADNPKLVLNSGFRTRAEQDALYKQKGPGLAAKPGSSNHERGTAADIGPPSEYAWLAQHGAEYGLKEPMPQKEPWHWEPTNAVGGSSSTPEDTTSQGAGQRASAATAGTPAGAGGGGGGFSLDPRLSLSAGTLGSGVGPPVAGTAAAAPAGASSSSSAASAGAGTPTATGGDVQSTILRMGQQMGATKQMLLAAFETGIVESGMRNLSGGDRDSAGVFQQRPSQGWGTKEQVMDVGHAAGEFFKRAANIRNARTAGQMAQAVQRSAFPARYDQHRADAASMLSNLGVDVSGVGDPVGTSGKIPPIMVMPGAPSGAGGSGRSIVIQRAEFIIQMQNGSQSEVVRAARQIKDLLSEDDRIVQAATT